MKELKEIVVCTTPFMVAALLVYPFMAIVGGDFDPFIWERNDREFYFLFSLAFGIAILYRIMYVRKEAY